MSEIVKAAVRAVVAFDLWRKTHEPASAIALAHKRMRDECYHLRKTRKVKG